MTRLELSPWGCRNKPVGTEPRTARARTKYTFRGTQDNAGGTAAKMSVGTAHRNWYVPFDHFSPRSAEAEMLCRIMLYASIFEKYYVDYSGGVALSWETHSNFRLRCLVGSSNLGPSLTLREAFQPKLYDLIGFQQT